MEKTIEERAKAYADEMVLGIKNYKSKSAKVQKVHWKSYYNQYVIIATKQRVADIEKAVEWLLKNGFVDMDEPGTDIHFKSGYIYYFRKAMED